MKIKAVLSPSLMESVKKSGKTLLYGCEKIIFVPSRKKIRLRRRSHFIPDERHPAVGASLESPL
jgi:hypothetical protein